MNILLAKTAGFCFGVDRAVKLTYDLRLRDPAEEKAFIDQLRRRNGNLEISISCQETAAAGL